MSREVSTREPAEIEGRAERLPYQEPAGKRAEEKHSTGLRGLRYSSALILGQWILGILFRNWTTMVAFAQEYSSAGCDNVHVDQADCARNTVIYRSSLALIVVLIVQAVGAILISTAFFDGFWLVKVPLTVLLNFAFLYPDINFDNDSFTWVARIGAFTFIALQSILFLDWAYNYNRNAVQDAMKSGAMGAAGRTFDNTIGNDVAMARNDAKLLVLVLFSLFSFIIHITSMGLLYAYYGTEGCSNNITIITVGFVGTIMATIIQLTISSSGSILTSSIVGLYVSFLTYTSVSLNPRAECNSSLANNAGDGMYGVGALWIGIILSLLSFLYTIYFSARSITKFLAEDLPLRNLVNVVLLGKTSGVEYSYAGPKLDFDSKLRSILLYLTCVLCLIVFYLSMVFTNWGTIASDNEVITSIAAGDVAMYMNAAGAWIAIGLYLIALIFPQWGDCMPKSVWDLKPKM